MINKLFFLPVILSYSLPTFIFKELTDYFNNYEIIIFYHLLYHIFLVGTILIIVFFDKKPAIQFVRNTSGLPTRLKLIMASIVVLGLISQYSYFQLLRGMDVTSLLTIVRGMSTLVVMLVGYLIYKENLTPGKILGIFMVAIGVIIVNNY